MLTTYHVQTATPNALQRSTDAMTLVVMYVAQVKLEVAIASNIIERKQHEGKHENTI